MKTKSTYNIEEEMKKQEQARRLVEREVIQCIPLTITEALKEQPELLLEAENYEKARQEYNAGEPNPDNWDEPEFYEFWSITEWLYEKLKEKGEVVFEYLDFYVWARQATGSSLALSPALQEIAKEYDF